MEIGRVHSEEITLSKTERIIQSEGSELEEARPVQQGHDVITEVISGMIPSNTAIKYHAIYLNKTIQLFQLRREDSF